MENQFFNLLNPVRFLLQAKYVNDQKLGGIMFWSIDNDDFRGTCHGRPYPIIEAAKEALFGIDSE
jgi:Chitinase